MDKAKVELMVVAGHFDEVMKEKEMGYILLLYKSIEGSEEEVRCQCTTNLPHHLVPAELMTAALDAHAERRRGL